MSFLKNPLIKISLRNGFIAGVLGFAILLALYSIGKHPMLFQLFFDFRIILFGVFLSLTVKEIRDTYQEGIIYFWQGMIACLTFTIVFAFITSGLIWLCCLVYKPFLSTYVELAVEQMKAIPADAIQQIGKEVYESNLKALPATNGYNLAKHYFWQSFVISFFISVIISVILRRQPKNE